MQANNAVEKVQKAEAKARNDEVTRTARLAVQQVQEQKREEDQTATDTRNKDEVAISNINTRTAPLAENLESVAQAAKVKAETKAEQKTELLDTLIELRAQRTALIERFNVVLDELKANAGDIEEYAKYRDAVDEVMVVPNNSIWGSVVTKISRAERRRLFWKK